MTQQINLYARKVEQKRGPALASLAFVVIVAAALTGYWQMLRNETAALRTRIAAASSQLETEKASLKVMKDALAKRTDPARLAAELAALRTRALGAQQIMSQFQRGDLGTMDGFSGHLVALARIGEPGVWLTSFKILNSGKAVQIEGRSLEAQAVLRYAGEVNQRFAGYGASLNSVELTPMMSAATAVPAVSFKLF